MTSFCGLADPTRRAILARLALGEATPGELAQPFQISAPATSRHLRVLERAGLIVRKVDGQRRPCRLNPEALFEVDRWLDEFRAVLEANYERLDARLDGPEGGDE